MGEKIYGAFRIWDIPISADNPKLVCAGDRELDVFNQLFPVQLDDSGETIFVASWSLIKGVEISWSFSGGPTPDWLLKHAEDRMLYQLIAKHLSSPMTAND